MAGLLYRDDMDDVRARLTAWWHGGDIGRPAMLLTVRRQEPLEDIPKLPKPEGWTTNYSVKDYAYRLNIALREPGWNIYMGEAVPAVTADLGPGSLALFLGSTMVDGQGTAWFEPCIDDPATARFEYDPENFYWRFVMRLMRDIKEHCQGKFMLHVPDILEGLDVLAAMRGTGALLTDLMDRPEWVRACNRPLTDMYFRYYDIIYDLIRDEVGGSCSWCWAPGRSAKLQCDFSAMISPEMFGEFMVPVLVEMTERLSYSMYHWDGPGAIPHLDHLVSIPRLGMIQWTPGDGVEPIYDKRWWPLYHKALDAGKSMMLIDGYGDMGTEQLGVLKREFGTKLNRCMICMSAKTVEDGEKLLAFVTE
jgi:hypothetical protein